VKFVEKYLPSSNLANGEVVSVLPQSQSFNEYVARGDQKLSSNDHLFARYYLDKYDDIPSLTPANYLTTVSSAQIYSHNAIVGETHTFIPNLLNDVRLSFSRISDSAGPPTNSISVADLGVGVTQPTAFAKAIDGISVSGYFSVSSFPPSTINRENYILNDDVSWVHGANTFAFGGVISRVMVILRDAYLAGGTFSFAADNTGNALASYLLGSIRTFQQGNGEFKDDRDYQATLYAQDDFHASRHLTLNLGTRWEPFIPFYEVDGRVEQFRASNYYAGITSVEFPNAPAGLLFPGDAGMPKYGVTASYGNFAPRVGFAFDPSGDGKSSLRGGFGVFFDSQQIGIENNRSVDISPFSTQVAVTTPTGAFSNPYQGMTNPFPSPAIPTKNAIFPTPVLVVTYDPSDNSREEAPVTYNYNLTVEHQFPQAILGRLAYVGSLLRHQNAGISSQSDSALPDTNPLRHQFDYGHSDFDHRHVMTASYVWDLPKLTNQNIFLREALGGWQTTGIVTYESGAALTLLAGSDRSQTGLDTDRAEQISPNVYGATACVVTTACRNYLNPAAFVRNYTATSYPLGTAGNTSKDAFNEPQYWDFDAGLLKNFAAVADRVHLQFHAEFFKPSTIPTWETLT
jgi:hypothetical protein